MRVFHVQKNIIIRHLRVRSVLRLVSNVLHGMQEVEKVKSVGGTSMGQYELIINYFNNNAIILSKK